LSFDELNDTVTLAVCQFQGRCCGPSYSQVWAEFKLALSFQICVDASGAKRAFTTSRDDECPCRPRGSIFCSTREP